MIDAPASPATAPRLMMLALKQPTIALTGLYLLTAVIGMVVAYFKYKAYGLLIFAWWEPSDFFLAAFREPGTFGLTAGAVIIPAALWWAIRVVFGRTTAPGPEVAQSRLRRWLNHNAFAHRVNHLSAQAVMWGLVAYGVFFFFLSAASGAFLLYASVPAEVRIHLTDGRTLPAAAGEGCFLLGTSNQYLFVGTTARRGVHGGKVSVLPVDSVTSLELLAPPKD